MSDTRRWTMPGWDSSDPEFARLFPHIKTAKHQQRDRPSRVMPQKFSQHTRNTLYALRHKLEQARRRESMNG